MTQSSRGVEKADPRHYQYACSLALAFIFVVQMDQGFLFAGLLVAGVGLLGVWARMRYGPLWFLTAFGLAQALPNLLGLDFRVGAGGANFNITDLVLALAVVVFVAGLYSLQAIWNNILPLDPRERAGAKVRRFPWFAALQPMAPRRRPVGDLTRREIAVLLLGAIPAVGLAQAAWLILAAPPNALDLSTRLWQIVFVSAALVLGGFFIGQAMWLWKRRRMSLPMAVLLLQEDLWQQTRGDQCRVQRWLAWDRVRRCEKQTEE